MNLPSDFQFSQASLQNFADCKRRFLLRHIWRLSWPAVETEPVLEHERTLQQGAAFHRYAQQFLVGVPAERLEAMIQETQTMEWWHSFLQTAAELKELAQTAGWKLYPEQSISATLEGVRIVAKYDLVAAAPQGKLLIYDWKTSRAKPKRQQLGKRLQTRVYPYLLARAGQQFNHNQPVEVEQVDMVYWYANHQGQSVRFPYSTDAYRADAAYLSSLIKTIQRLAETEFQLTADEKRCAYCTYRSLCNRGTSAGSIADLQLEVDIEDTADISLDFEQIAEIEF